MNIIKEKRNSDLLRVFIVIAILVFFVSCAAGPNDLAKTANADGKTASFFQGLWHGFISFFTFIISLFSKKVNVYEVHNSGILYNLGFIIGVSAFFGGGGGAGCRAYKSRKDE